MANRSRCRFCGETVKPGMKLCKTCLREKYSEVNLMFGTTNGWDRKPREKVKVENGWRGRMVVGMKTSVGKYKD